MLKKTRSKAKMIEYDIPSEHHIEVESNANELLLISIAAIGNISAEILKELTPHRTIPEDKKLELEFASRYFDAFFNSGLEPHYDQYYPLLGSIAYYFCDYIGSSKVMSNMISIDRFDVGCGGIETVLVNLLRDDLNRELILDENSLYYEYLVQIVDAYNSYFVDFNNVNIEFIRDFRKLVYAHGSPRELLLTDAMLAIFLTKIERSAFHLLPIYSTLSYEIWKGVLEKQNNIKELWPAQIKLGESDVFKGNSAVIQMPTSSGKTTSISIIIRSAFISNKTSLAVVVAPYRALCREISFDIANNFSDDSKIHINELSDVLEIDDTLDLAELFSFDTKNIIVLTPEKLIYLLRQSEELFSSIGLILFDEAHIFDDPSRGARYELLLATIIGYLGEDIQKILISAVIPNASQINDWFTQGTGSVIADNSIKASEKSVAICDWNRQHGDYGYLYFIDPDDSNAEDFYVPRVINIQALKKLRKNEKDRIFPQVDFEHFKVKHNDMAIFLANKLHSNGGVAIFCGKKNTVDSVLDRIMEIEKRGVDISSFISNIKGSEHIKIANLIKENYGDDNVYFIASQKGIFAHHGGISSGIRISVEFAMKEDLIRCVVCTSTLAQGVNLPIKYLIISNLYQANEPIKIRDFHNLIGRAGRAGLFTEGTIILSEPFVYSRRKVNREKWRWKKYREMMDSGNSESCLSELLLLVRPEKVELAYNKVLTINFYKLIIIRYNDINSYEDHIEKLINTIKTNYPQKELALSGLINRIRNCLEAVESYLLSFLADENSEQDIVSILVNTFGYYLATEEEREKLEQLFLLIQEYLIEQTGDISKRMVFSRTLLGVDQLNQLEDWIKDNLSSLIECEDSSEILPIITPKLIEYADNKTLKAIISVDEVANIAGMWINGESYKSILDYTKEKGVLITRRKKAAEILLNEVIEICDNGFGYSSTLVMNAISELLLLNCEEDQGSCKILNELTKKMRYGLPTKRSIAIYEAGFSDRVLAQEMSTILTGIPIKNKKQVKRAIRKKQVDVANLLLEFPSIFTDRLSKI